MFYGTKKMKEIEMANVKTQSHSMKRGAKNEGITLKMIKKID